MKPSTDSELVKIPSSLLAEVQEAANEEHCTHEELLREAVERISKTVVGSGFLPMANNKLVRWD
jgi:hypothetical protein